jgi:hypothetical protein
MIMSKKEKNAKKLSAKDLKKLKGGLKGYAPVSMTGASGKSLGTLSIEGPVQTS